VDHASLHLAPDRYPCQLPTIQFYRPDALPETQPTVSALKAKAVEHEK